MVKIMRAQARQGDKVTYHYTEYEYQRRRRQATLSFTYRLNQKKKRGGNRGEGDRGGDMDGY